MYGEGSIRLCGCILHFSGRAAERQGEKEELAALDEKANSPCREADNGAILCCAFVPLGQAAWAASNTLAITPPNV